MGLGGGGGVESYKRCYYLRREKQLARAITILYGKRQSNFLLHYIIYPPVPPIPSTTTTIVARYFIIISPPRGYVEFILSLLPST